MFVCVCYAVTEKDVLAAIDEGAESVAAVTRATKAGGDCGSCRATIEEMIDQQRSRRRLKVIKAA